MQIKTTRTWGSTDDTIDKASSTKFEVIFGSDDDDVVKVGSGGSVVFAGYRQDTIELNQMPGVKDVMVYRFESESSGTGLWNGVGGGDTIENFEHGVGIVVFVDVDTKEISDLADLSRMITVADPSTEADWMNYETANTGGGLLL